MLNKLPTELKAMISAELGALDFGSCKNLRQVNKEFSYIAAKEVFDRISLVLHPLSWKNAEHIAESPHLACCVKTLVFIRDRLDVGMKSSTNFNLFSTPGAQRKHFKAFRGDLEWAWMLEEHGRMVPELSKMIRNFHLNKVFISSISNIRDMCDLVHMPNPRRALQRICVGYKLCRYGVFNCLDNNDCLKTLIAAFAEAEKPITHLYADKIWINDLPGFGNEKHYYGTNEYQAQCLLKVFSTLKDFHADFTRPRNDKHNENTPLSNLAQFFSAAPNLQSLHLQMLWDLYADDVENYEDDLKSCDLSCVLSGLRFPKLKHLALVHMSTPSPILLELIDRHSYTLESLSLTRIDLHDNWKPPPPGIEISLGPWQLVARAINKNQPPSTCSLQYLRDEKVMWWARDLPKDMTGLWMTGYKPQAFCAGLTEVVRSGEIREMPDWEEPLVWDSVYTSDGEEDIIDDDTDGGSENGSDDVPDDGDYASGANSDDDENMSTDSHATDTDWDGDYAMTSDTGSDVERLGGNDIDEEESEDSEPEDFDAPVTQNDRFPTLEAMEVWQRHPMAATENGRFPDPTENSVSEQLSSSEAEYLPSTKFDNASLANIAILATMLTIQKIG